MLPSNRPCRRVTMSSRAAIPDQLREDDTLPRTGRWRWPMRLATSTTGQASHQPATKWDKNRPLPRPFCPFSSPTSSADLFPGPFAVRRLGRPCNAEGLCANRETDSRPRRGAEPSAAARPARRLFPSPFWPVKKGTSDRQYREDRPSKAGGRTRAFQFA
jgi:hypothetical protein